MAAAFQVAAVSMSVNYYLSDTTQFFGVLIIVLLLEQQFFCKKLSTGALFRTMGQVLEKQAQYATEASLMLFMLKMNFKKIFGWIKLNVIQLDQGKAKIIEEMVMLELRKKQLFLNQLDLG